MFDTPKSEVILLYAKTPISEGLRRPQKPQKSEVLRCFKNTKNMCNTPKSEVILLYTKTPKSEGLCPLQKHQTAKTPYL